MCTHPRWACRPPPAAQGSEASPAARNTLDSARIPRASKLLICGLFQKGRVLAQDGVAPVRRQKSRPPERSRMGQRVAVPVGNMLAMLSMGWRTAGPTSSMFVSTSGFSVKGAGRLSGSGSIDTTAW